MPGEADAGAGSAGDNFCCDEFRSAVEVTFAAPVDGPTGWLLYGTDAESVGGGSPELRYWAAQFCPFCGAALRRLPREQLRRTRQFGYGQRKPHTGQ